MLQNLSIIQTRNTPAEAVERSAKEALSSHYNPAGEREPMVPTQTYPLHHQLTWKRDRARCTNQLPFSITSLLIPASPPEWVELSRSVELKLLIFHIIVDYEMSGLNH